MPNPSMKYDRIFRNLFYEKWNNILPLPQINRRNFFSKMLCAEKIRDRDEELKRQIAACNNFEIEKVVDQGCAVNRKRDVYMIQEPR